MAQSKRKSTKTEKAPSKRGGKRAGSGRKTKEFNKLRGDFNAATNQTLVEFLPDLLRNLKVLADGGYERVEETFEEDESVVISLAKSPPPADAAPRPGRKLVCVKRVVSRAEPDRSANEYLINRLLGRPKQAVEHSGPDGAPIKAYIGFDPDEV